MYSDIDFENLEQSLAQLSHRLSHLGHSLTFELQTGASEDALKRCEESIRMPIPTSLRRLLKQHDGGVMSIDYTPGFSHDMYLYSVDDIIDDDEHFRKWLTRVDRHGITSLTRTHAVDDPNHFWSGLIAFAKYGVGICLLDTDQRNGEDCAIVDLDVEDLEDTRGKRIANSLQSWFAQIIAAAEREFHFVYWLPGLDL